VDDTITVTIERQPAGGLRFTIPGMPDWAATAHGAFEIARAIDAAWTETDIAAYARRRGTIRDAQVWDDLLDHTRRPCLDGRHEPDIDAPPRPRHLRVVRAAETRAAAARPVTTQGDRELQRAREWSRRADGAWRSPAGRWFRSDSEHVRRIVAILTEHGEEPRPFPELYDANTLTEVRPLRTEPAGAAIREG
jgi:hypothetical protein